MKLDNNVRGYIAAALAGLVIGYFAGREHMKYEIRSAFQSAAEDMRRNLSSVLGGHSSDQGSSNRQPPPASTSNVPSPLEVTLLQKGFKSADIHAGDFEDDITMVLSLKNVTDKDIRAFDGTLIFTDLLEITLCLSRSQ